MSNHNHLLSRFNTQINKYKVKKNNDIIGQKHLYDSLERKTRESEVNQSYERHIVYIEKQLLNQQKINKKLMEQNEQLNLNLEKMYAKYKKIQFQLKNQDKNIKLIKSQLKQDKISKKTQTSEKQTQILIELNKTNKFSSVNLYKQNQNTINPEYEEKERIIQKLSKQLTQCTKQLKQLHQISLKYFINAEENTQLKIDLKEKDLSIKNLIKQQQQYNKTSKQAELKKKEEQKIKQQSSKHDRNKLQNIIQQKDIEIIKLTKKIECMNLQQRNLKGNNKNDKLLINKLKNQIQKNQTKMRQVEQQYQLKIKQHQQQVQELKNSISQLQTIVHEQNQKQVSQQNKHLQQNHQIKNTQKFISINKHEQNILQKKLIQKQNQIRQLILNVQTLEISNHQKEQQLVKNRLKISQIQLLLNHKQQQILNFIKQYKVLEEKQLFSQAKIKKIQNSEQFNSSNFMQLNKQNKCKQLCQSKEIGIQMILQTEDWGTQTVHEENLSVQTLTEDLEYKVVENLKEQFSIILMQSVNQLESVEEQLIEQKIHYKSLSEQYCKLEQNKAEIQESLNSKNSKIEEYEEELENQREKNQTFKQKLDELSNIKQSNQDNYEQYLQLRYQKEKQSFNKSVSTQYQSGEEKEKKKSVEFESQLQLQF